jgi:hypothetical protein
MEPSWANKLGFQNVGTLLISYILRKNLCFDFTRTAVILKNVWQTHSALVSNSCCWTDLTQICIDNSAPEARTLDAKIYVDSELIPS